MRITYNAKYLVDTNILLYTLDKKSPFHKESVKIMNNKRRAELVVAQQNLLELVAVLRRGFKVPLKQAIADAQIFANNLKLIFPRPQTWLTFTGLAEKVRPTIYPFDIFLAATMLDNGIDKIITANKKDFVGLGLSQVLAIVG